MAEDGTKISTLNSVSAQSQTFVIQHEDHTLGNALRYTVMRNAATKFCGYSVPHPSEPLMHIRIQTSERSTSEEVLKDGLKSLRAACEHIDDVFTREVEKHQRK